MRMQSKGYRIQDITPLYPPLARGELKGGVMHHASCIVYLVLFLLLTSYLSLSYADEKGVPINMELRDVELSEVLRALGQEHSINIIIDEKVTGKVTVSLKNVPLWDAIDSILKGKGFAYIKDGDIVRIAPLIADEDLATYTATVKYANPKDLEGIITKVLSKRGSIAYDLTRTSNMVVIRDIPSAIERVTQLLKQVDVKTKQIMIEAKIVEVSTNASRELGIQWGAQYTKGDVTVHGGGTTTVPLTGGTGFRGSAFNVNLPAAVKAGAGGAIGIGILAKNAILDFQLSALESQGSARTLSSPKVIVLDNQEAHIKSGTGILVATLSASGTTTTTAFEEKQAVLQLKVTPRVINDDQISLKIFTTRDSFDFSRSVQGNPPKNTRETQTNLIVKNGETIVIGGIYTETESESEGGVPWLSKIPVLRWLFKKETKTKDATELLIFITPSIKAE
ncbi:MAG: secretin and TonB N-terminal domain-containing protein [Nitrospirota bacterium]|nr:secretin and TonB N-terminal domain-containing protein [Nitrospirota bacterium]